MPKLNSAQLYQLQSLCDRNGFIYPASKFGTYLKGNYVFGPLGTEMKRNFLHEWWLSVVTEQEHVEGIDSPQTEFHNQRYLSSKDHVPIQLTVGDGSDQTESTSNASHLTLQHSLGENLFQYYLKMPKGPLPFGLAQVGQCHRSINQNVKKKFIFQVPEFTQFCMLFFCSQKDGIRWQDTWQRERLKWWRKYAGQPSDFTSTEVKTEGSRHTIEIQYPFPWGDDVVERITNYGSSAIDEYREKQGLKVKTSNKIHMIKISGSMERGMLAYLCDGFNPRRKTGKASGQTGMMKFHRRISPYKLAILPEILDREVTEISSYLANNFRTQQGWNVLHCSSHSGNLEKEIKRLDEMGVPYTILVGERTLDSGEVRIRDRDTEMERQEHITRIMKVLQSDIR